VVGLTPKLDEFAAPECQFQDCDADAETAREHPQFGEIQVCSTCATLFGGGSDG
jgi:hypothetical protein